ncbi:hypothetical protein [Nocardia sp. NPDC004711]
MIKTVPSNLTVDDLHQLAMRGARPAGPPPGATVARRVERFPAAAVIELERSVNVNGVVGICNHRVKIGPELAERRIVLRLDGHLLHAVHDGVLAKTLPAPMPVEERAKLRGARVVTTPLPAPAPGPISVQRKVPRNGVIMVARQNLRVGRTYAGRIVTVHAEDTHFRVTCDGAEIGIYPRITDVPIRRWKAKIHAPKL